METTKTHGIVKDGVIVPNTPIPEGYRVTIEFVAEQLVFTSEEQSEFDALRTGSQKLLRTVEDLAEEITAHEKGRSLAS